MENEIQNWKEYLLNELNNIPENQVIECEIVKMSDEDKAAFDPSQYPRMWAKLNVERPSQLDTLP